MPEVVQEVDLWGNPIEKPVARDWTGDTHSVFVTVGASNHSKGERQSEDYYASDPIAAEWLLKLEEIQGPIWEPCCGGGHLAKVFSAHGYDVTATDLVDRGYGRGGVNFLDPSITKWDGSIITNPPFSIAQEIIDKALEIIPDGQKVCMFLRVLFLEGQRRRALFEKYPPKKVWVTSRRIICAKNGDFKSNTGGAQAYMWAIWVKGYNGETTIGWFN